MPDDKRPVLSVIVRRFEQKFDDDVERLVKNIQKAAARQPGFVGLQNSLSHKDDYSELVTVFAFDSVENLERWKTSPIREGFVDKLDKHTLNSSTHMHFGDLAQLLHPKAKLSKIETVVILILWILAIGAILGYVADLVLPGTFDPLLRQALLVSVNVVLISYVFLPWSSMKLSRLKTRLTKRPPNR